MTKRMLLSCAAALALVAGGATGAPAKSREDVEVAGTCTGGSSSKLKLGDEDGRIEVEFEVDQNRNGVRWQVVLRRNGRVVRRLTRVTRGPSGSFEARMVARNAAGRDRFVATAARRGESCRAQAAF
jgi:hypothetical protein